MVFSGIYNTGKTSISFFQKVWEKIPGFPGNPKRNPVNEEKQGSASGSGGPEPDRAEPDFGLRAGLRDGFQKSRAPGSARFFARARAQPDVSPIFAYFED